MDTLIGSAVAVIAVLASPSAPAPAQVVADAVAPIRRCRDILQQIGSAIGSAWTLEEAEAWRTEALGLVEATAKAGRNHQDHQLNARWNARARREGTVLEQAEEALRVGERVAVQTRSIARALVDGAAGARPLPAFGNMLIATASALDAYATWLASPGELADRQRLSEAIRLASKTFAQAVDRAKRIWGDDPTQWLTFGTILAMSQRMLVEVGTPLDSTQDEPA